MRTNTVIKRRGYASIGLVCPKNRFNIGGVMRAAYVYNAAMIAIEKARYKKQPEDTPQAWRHIPVLHTIEDIFSVIPYDAVPVAVDLLDGATPLPEFTHPDRAFYIFGPEDGTLGKRIVNRCKSKIYIPTRSCMNLAATVNVVLYDRILKRKEY